MSDADAETSLVVEAYHDIVSPSAKIVGETLANVTRLLIRPIDDAVARATDRRRQIAESVAQRMKGVPRDRWIEPAVNVAGPALQAALFTANDTPLREMYARLLATAMDSQTADAAHPAYVEIIRQLTPDEARLVALFRQRSTFPCARIGMDSTMFGGTVRNRIEIPFYSTLNGLAHLSNPQRIVGYVDNAVRLGLLRRTDYPQQTFVKEEAPSELAETIARYLSLPSRGGVDTDTERARLSSEVVDLVASLHLERGDSWFFETWLLEVTEFGHGFCAACIDTAIID